jgi:hypothetical protein
MIGFGNTSSSHISAGRCLNSLPGVVASTPSISTMSRLLTLRLNKLAIIGDFLFFLLAAKIQYGKF